MPKTKKEAKQWTVKTTEDEIYSGTADEVVQAMADAKFTPVRSLGGYRRATANRISQLFGVNIDPSNSETFLKTMVAGKVLEDLTEPS